MLNELKIGVSGEAICPGCFETIVLLGVVKNDTGECPSCPIDYEVQSEVPLLIQVKGQKTFEQDFGDEMFGGI